jgi:chaperonin GroES
MKIKPLGKRILAKKLEPEERKTSGGIVLPESAQSEKVIRAKVLELGTEEKFSVEKGDEIIVSSFAGTEIEIDEDKLLLVKESDILAVIK